MTGVLLCWINTRRIPGKPLAWEASWVLANRKCFKRGGPNARTKNFPLTQADNGDWMARVGGRSDTRSNLSRLTWPKLRTPDMCKLDAGRNELKKDAHADNCSVRNRMQLRYYVTQICKPQGVDKDKEMVRHNTRTGQAKRENKRG